MRRCELVVSFGDAIEIEGDGQTVAKACPADPDNGTRETIRIDQFTRENAGVAIDDPVTVRWVSSEKAREVILSSSPVPNLSFNDEAGDAARGQLLLRPVIEGDTVPILREIESSNAPRFRVPLIVAETEPEGAVFIRESTEVSIRKE